MLIRELLKEQDENLPLRSAASNWQAFLDAVPRLETSLDMLDVGVKIYRGIRSEDPVKFKPQMHKGYRQSANTDNYYTLIMDHDPAWRRYPPRSASVIATTNVRYAMHFGNPYLLLPEGDPLVGVCPDDDLWGSFEALSQIDFLSLEDLNTALKNIFRLLTVPPQREFATYKQLQQALREAYNNWEEIADLSREQLDQKGLYDMSIDLLKYKPNLDLEQKIQDLLNPRTNNFATAFWGELDAYTRGAYEVWFSAPTWMISVDALPENLNVTKGVRQALLAFAQEQADKAS